MTRHRLSRRLGSVLVLTGVWCALWGTISIANLGSGLVLALAFTTFDKDASASGPVRVLPLLHLAGLVFVDLIKSTVNVAQEIVSPGDGTDESIIAVDLPAAARDHLLLLVVAVTLTPGTAVIDADPGTGQLYLHLLHANRREETARHVHEIARLASEALPVRSRRATT